MYAPTHEVRPQQLKYFVPWQVNECAGLVFQCFSILELKVILKSVAKVMREVLAFYELQFGFVLVLGDIK